MIKGLFVNKAGMFNQQRRLEIATNNLANLNTIGFKKEKSFSQKLVEATKNSAPSEGKQSTGNAKIDFSPGNLRKTDNPLDVAISGDGFFVVQTEEGNFYTRNGSFRLDATGRLVTQDGYSVLTDAGELQIHGGSVRLSESGEIVMNDQIVGRLRLVTFEDLRSLEKVGDAHFRLREGAELELPAAETNLRPGYLEGSNVNSISEMVSMIELNRQYELGQRAIKTQDETLERLINQAGRS